MESSLCLQCLQIMNRSLRTPLGQAVVRYFGAQRFPDEIDFLGVRAALEANRYASPAHWLDALSERCDSIVSFFGAEAEIALAVLTVAQNVRRMAQPLLGGASDRWRESVAALLRRLDEFAAGAPNGYAEYAAFTEERDEGADDAAAGAGAADASQTGGSGAVSAEKKAVDVNELKDMIQRIDNDEDMQNIARIVSHYEPEFRKITGTVECDLRKLSEGTQRMLYNYAVKHVPPLPAKVNPSAIPRMRSTPLPQSFLAEAVASTMKIDPPKIAAMPTALSLAETSPFLKISLDEIQKTIIQNKAGNPGSKVMVKPNEKEVKEQESHKEESKS